MEKCQNGNTICLICDHSSPHATWRRSTNIYLIEKAEVDPMENHPLRALEYKFAGFVTSETVAKNICETGGHFTCKDCWCIGNGNMVPKFRYTKLEPFQIKEIKLKATYTKEMAEDMDKCYSKS
jgi:hypothetical protein